MSELSLSWAMTGHQCVTTNHVMIKDWGTAEVLLSSQSCSLCGMNVIVLPDTHDIREAGQLRARRDIISKLLSMRELRIHCLPARSPPENV